MEKLTLKDHWTNVQRLKLLRGEYRVIKRKTKGRSTNLTNRIKMKTIEDEFKANKILSVK